jgi:hypothetical protein
LRVSQCGRGRENCCCQDDARHGLPPILEGNGRAAAHVPDR